MRVEPCSAVMFSGEFYLTGYLKILDSGPTL